ncbi:HoxN/HupN/NixA family nickel/cobalt transporter [Burkholderia sp. JP2-270]|uniref:HoxN/HupN/NixA family nickel/cobalt transporter n=1 Tax=Burkholderia sp. JP2-270 TaxID=2217913 RepID=UPI000DA2BA75|nr:HoxN/HupN/NixA family nickel/cobalt transporter [Burkholderia sp. JP2-270]AWV02896.1 HoxN/HupN/NixA family nickel/cobalt transporter [Burkholderia sp. JP2-270]
MTAPVLPGTGVRAIGVRGKLVVLFAALAAFNLAAWAWAVALFGGHPALMGACALAYTFGLRHAVDADHIAAIDNVTRKLMHEGQRPLTVGLMFSLGHSSIVIMASIAITAAAFGLRDRLAAFHDIAGTVGTLVSTTFLLAIAVANLVTLHSVVRTLRRVKRGERYADAHADTALHHHGFLARLLRPVLVLVTKSWHMYVLGALFGLGFDTATEIGVLGISATSAAHGMPVWSIMVFPALFTASMALVDTADSVLMLGVYGWAFREPVRKLYYNIGITAMSAAVALLVGCVEGFALLGDTFGMRGALRDLLDTLNAHLGAAGYAIIVLCAASWLVCAAIYRWKRGGGFAPLAEQDHG